MISLLVDYFMNEFIYSLVNYDIKQGVPEGIIVEFKVLQKHS